MKASELRIGNWINAYHNDVQVTSINSEPDHLSLQISTTPTLVGSTHGGMYFPIPLTEEWLIKFGFEKMPWDMRFRSEYYSKKYESDFKLSERVDLVFRKDKNVFAFNMAGLHIKHVHQLQNLYFALTGTELEIKDI